MVLKRNIVSFSDEQICNAYKHYAGALLRNHILNIL